MCVCLCVCVFVCVCVCVCVREREKERERERERDKPSSRHLVKERDFLHANDFLEGWNHKSVCAFVRLCVLKLACTIHITNMI